MIKYEILEDRPNIKRTYSNKGLKIKCVTSGEVFNEAYDLIESSRVYTETDIVIKDDEPELP